MTPPPGTSPTGFPSGVSNLPTPARLTVGIVSAGRVGTALGEALERAGHIVGAVVAPSPVSRDRAARRLPESQILPLAEVVARAELLILSVPDADLSTVIDEVAATGTLRPRTLVAHTAGAHGVAVLDPLLPHGIIPLALHPAMTFVDGSDDTARLQRACFGVTAADEVGDAIGTALVLEMGGEPVRIAEADRALYHAALAHGANHLVALISDAVTALGTAIERGAGAHGATVDGDATRLPERILAPLVSAALQNTLELGPAALTGPVARGDVEAVATHIAALADLPDGASPDSIAASYRTMARRAAYYTRHGSGLLDPLEDQ